MVEEEATGECGVDQTGGVVTSHSIVTLGSGGGG